MQQRLQMKACRRRLFLSFDNPIPQGIQLLARSILWYMQRNLKGGNTSFFQCSRKNRHWFLCNKDCKWRLVVLLAFGFYRACWPFRRLKKRILKGKPGHQFLSMELKEPTFVLLCNTEGSPSRPSSFHMTFNKTCSCCTWWNHFIFDIKFVRGNTPLLSM
jgi:hypothetical protein